MEENENRMNGKKKNMAKIKELLRQMTLEEKASLVVGASPFQSAGIERLGIRPLQFLDGGTGMNFEQLFSDLLERQFMEESGKDTAFTEELTHNNGMLSRAAFFRVLEFFYEPDALSKEEKKLHTMLKDALEKKTGMPELSPGCFPPGMLLGATFSPGLVRKVGQALGMEAQAFGIDILLGTPNVNLLRDPLNGRLFEGYSEDPCLVSVLAPELVKGVQEYPVAANVKHFAANNQETNRIGINETITRRALMELYLPGFRACVEEGGVRTVMSAYNRINGVACTENEWLLKDMLRKEWGFDGFVVSDWGAVYAPVKAVMAGNDLAMPGPLDPSVLTEAVRNGDLPESALDEVAGNILGVMDWLEEKKEGAAQEGLSAAALMDYTDQIAYEAACEGIVLLKNENAIFPILPDSGRQLVLVGTGREKLLTCGSGSAGITTDRGSSLYAELGEILGQNRVSLCGTWDELKTAYLNWQENIWNAIGEERPNKSKARKEQLAEYNAGKERLVEGNTKNKRFSGEWIKAPALTVLVVAALSGMEGNDRKDMDLDIEDRQLLQRLIKEKKGGADMQLGLLLNTCGSVELAEYEPDLDGIFFLSLPGMQGGRAMARLLCGRENPSGKLPLTFPRRYEDTPTFLNFPGDGLEVSYGEGIYVGYRYYDKKKLAPLYPFGYGLSYTTFEIGDIKVEEAPQSYENQISGTPVIRNSVTLSGKVKNTGSCAGAEVVQIYIHDVVSTHSRPVKELKAFQKLFLEPGQEKAFSFTLGKEAFAYFDMDHDCFLAEEGYYDLIVAASSAERDIAHTSRIYLDTESPYSYGLNSTIKVLYERKELKELLLEWWEKEGLDRGILDEAYQYTSSKKLRELVPEAVDVNPESNVRLEEFLHGLHNVIKP